MALSRLIQRLLGNSGSKAQAKHRLLTVLVSDRLGLSPEQMQALRRDILATIGRHLPVDSENVRIDFVHENTPAEVVINAPMRQRAKSA